MNTKYLFILALSSILLLNACTPFTIAGSSGEQPTPQEETVPDAASQTSLSLVPVEHVEVSVGVGSPIPAEIIASGTWPDLCAQIAEVKSAINEFQIDVTILARTTESCPPDHLGLPFRFALPLNVAELADGAYTITVNGTSITFEWPLKPDPLTGSISGLIWHDECVTALDGQPSLTNTPPGCVEDDPFVAAYHADGVHDTNEQSIESIIVKLREGDCTATSLADVKEQLMTIAPDLSFRFVGLKAGTYCVSIDPQEEPNITLLGPGVWTYPHVTQGIIAQTVTLASDEDKQDVNFGWDYQFQ